MRNAMLRVVLSLCVSGGLVAGNVLAQKAEKNAGKPAPAAEQTSKAVQEKKKVESASGGQTKEAKKTDGKEEAAPTAEDRPERLVQENNKHIRRMARIDRLTSVVQKQKNEKLTQKVAKLKTLEMKRHDRRLAKLGKVQSGDKPAKTKPVTKEQATKEAAEIPESGVEAEADKLIKTIEAEGN